MQFYAHFMVSAIRVEQKDLGVQGFGSVYIKPALLAYIFRQTSSLYIQQFCTIGQINKVSLSYSKTHTP